MIDHVLFDGLLLGVFCWLCMIGLGMWPRRPAALGQPQGKPPKPVTKRSKDPQPFPGLTHKPRWMPLPELIYAQVVKTYRRRRLAGVRHCVVFGTLEKVTQRLVSHGWQINTAFIERINLTICQHVAAVGRRVVTLCKEEDGVRQQLALYHVYYNFCLPHISLRLPLLQPLPTNGSGSAKTWRPRTPAMAAGLPDRVWTLREVLRCRVPPWPNPRRCKWRVRMTRAWG